MKLSELAQKTGAQIEGHFDDIEITGAAGLDLATPGQVTFLANRKYTPQVARTRASAIYVGEGAEVKREIAILRARDPYLAYTRALRLFHQEPAFTPFRHTTAAIDPSARLSEDVWIGACVFVGRDVEIGERVRIYPNVTIYDGVHIGADSVIHSGAVVRENTFVGERVVIYNNAVVGSDGFGYAKDEENRWLKIPQTGRVVLEDDVEVGACACVDKASVGETRIGRGTKIDNLVQVGHSCTVGEDTLLCAQVGLAGSSHVGSRVILAGQVGVGGHLTIGDDAVLMAQAGTFKDVPAGSTMSGGVPAFDHRESLKVMTIFPKLPEMQRTIRTLEARLRALEKSLSNTEESSVKETGIE
ncbi:MAG: UDP-3-O-(3-hydroxymyristoyl)glucosamine N-acyltransferase [Acidobacteria bacterium]|nr:MAG: UDP-3-O-(3-hydroxymyristoyl)glucosamine N-acyltransferase [Acidobacteriota bacterium]